MKRVMNMVITVGRRRPRRRLSANQEDKAVAGMHRENAED